MAIDWVTVAAQLVNFLVLVWLLERLLYRPVTRSLEARAEAVRARLDAAETARAEAEREAGRLAERRAAFEADREDRRREMLGEIEDERARLAEEARAAVAEERRDWERRDEEERAAFLARLRLRAAEAMARLSRRALDDLADETLERRMAAVFLRRVAGLDAEARADLAAAAQGGARLVSAFPLPEETERELRAALAEALGEGTEIAVATDPDLGCGLRLEAGSRRLGWTVSGYLDALEAEMAEAVSEGAAPAARPC